jgi:predicted unusual protein kinase regulating ubiquinone biosynthesis (AarF/ABC1/UbiB family)
MISVSDKKEEFDEKEFTRQVADLVGRNKTMTVQQVAIGRMVLEIHRLAAEYGIRSPSETATLGKTLLNLDEVGSALNPAFQPNESIRQNATNLLQRRMSSSFEKRSSPRAFASMRTAKSSSGRTTTRTTS